MQRTRIYDGDIAMVASSLIYRSFSLYQSPRNNNTFQFQKTLLSNQILQLSKNSYTPTLVQCCSFSSSSSGSKMSSQKNDDKEAKLWGGRFEESVTETVENFTESISFDKALYKHDIMGSRAHATMLANQVLAFVSILSSFN